MIPEFGKSERPREQWPLIAPKGKPPQAKWILGVFADAEFSLLAIDAKSTEDDEWTEPQPYSELWTELAAMDLAPGKWWMIGHRVRYALDQADMLDALANGDIRLPRSKKKGATHKRSGKLAYSLNCLEIDLVAGKNQIKVLDWKNFGFDPPTPAPKVFHVDQAQALALWIDYVELCRQTGMLLTKTTAAQMGWQRARMHHGPAVIMYNLDPRAREMERRSYFGGRNEPYTLGDIDDATFSLDVKSFYASICRDCNLPVYMTADYPAGLPVEDIDPGDTYHWIADVVISTPAADYPMKHHGTTLYPVGNFCTTLAWPELRHALQRGRVEKVLRAGRYQVSLAMCGFADWYLAARSMVKQSGRPALDHAIKSAFNGALGFTARQKYSLVPWAMDIDRAWWLGYTSAPDHSAPIVHAQVLDGVKEWLKIGGEPREAMPFLHSTICSWGRMILLRIMETAGREWIHYCDTDGILVDYRGYAALADTPGIIGDAPGQLAERFPSGPCRVQGQKDYRIGNHVICSGMHRAEGNVWRKKTVLETPTGIVNYEGKVRPFEFRCEDIGGETPRYVNILA